MEATSEQIAGLSDQQKAILRLVQQGLRSKEIAPIVQLAPASVDTYVRRAMGHLGAADRRSAARMLADFEQSERFVSQSPDLSEPVGDRKKVARRLGRFILSMAIPPPIGGSKNDLTVAGRIREMLRVACLLVTVVSALTLVFVGAMRALH